MKKKMMFALLLAGSLFATPSKVEAQGTAKVAGGATNATEECRDDKTACIKCGGSCAVVCCDSPAPPTLAMW